MFINCPLCKALVATDPATDLPPEHCPRCAAKLREVQLDARVDAASGTSPGDDPAAIATPPLDPAPLLHAPPPDAPFPDGPGSTAPSELSSRIHQIIADEPLVAAPAAIAPIATMLKPPDDDLAPVPAARQPTPGTASITEPASANPPEPAGMPANATGPIAEAGDTLTRTAAAAGVADAGVVVAQAASETRTKGGAAVTEATAGPVLATFHPGTMPVASASAAAASPGATPPANRLLPSFAHRRARLGAPRFHWKTLAAISALALLLMLQLLLADRAQLATNARWRPLLSNVCGVLGCTLPPWREPMAFTVLAREVRPHPSTPGALRVTATFRNDARWPQPWPQLRLTLSDVNGNAVATRDFSARDYLGAPPTQVELGSGQSASIAMDIVEPASRSVAFDFELH